MVSSLNIGVLVTSSCCVVLLCFLLFVFQTVKFLQSLTLKIGKAPSDEFRLSKEVVCRHLQKKVCEDQSDVVVCRYFYGTN